MIIRGLAGRGSGIRRRSRWAGAAQQAGFTLLEVLVVLVILGLLAAVVAGPQIFKYLGTAKSEAAKVQVAKPWTSIGSKSADTRHRRKVAPRCFTWVA